MTVSGVVEAQESPDTAAFSGTVTVVGTLTAQEVGNDTAVFLSPLEIPGILIASESGADAAVLRGVVYTAIIGVVKEYTKSKLDTEFYREKVKTEYQKSKAMTEFARGG